MATVPAGVIVIWPSTNASIPAGWTRETALDTYYVRGAQSGADADYGTHGQATHNHTSPPHTPIQAPHNHTANVPTNVDSFPIPGTAGAAPALALDTHTHNASSSQTTTALNNPFTLVVNQNTSNDLLYTTVIFIKSNGSPTGIPVGAYGFLDVDVFPVGWSRVVLTNPYIKGANTGADAGAQGGSLTHTHTTPAHTHTQQAHSHTHSAAAGVGSGSPTGSVLDTSAAKIGHSHPLTHNPVTATNNPTTLTMSDENHEPLNLTLNIMSNGNAAPDLPIGLIALWGGLNANIPASWARYTLMDGYFTQGATADGQSAVLIGGSVNHTHMCDDCSPTQNSHVHTITDAGTGSTAQFDSGVTRNYAATGHTHSNWVPGAKTALTNGTSVSIDPNVDESAYPPYKYVIFIQYTGELPHIMTTYDYKAYDGSNGIDFNSLASPDRDHRWKFPQEETEEERKKRRQIQEREKGIYGPPYRDIRPGNTETRQ